MLIRSRRKSSVRLVIFSNRVRSPHGVKRMPGLIAGCTAKKSRIALRSIWATCGLRLPSAELIGGRVKPPAASLVRQHLERRRVRLDAQRVVGDEADLLRRRLFEIAVGGLAHRILPNRQRALRRQ